MSNSNRVVGIAFFSEAIMEVLKEYGQDAEEAVTKAVKKTAKKGKKELQSVSPVGRTGDYAKSWSTKDMRAGIRGASVTIYSKTPGLPHLLEYGHAIVDGTGRTHGSTRSNTHIAPVEAGLEKTMVEELEKALK